MSKALNELKKATMASYLAKAGKTIRADTSIAASFDDEVYKHMRVANDNHPNVINGKEKDPEKLKNAEHQMKVNADLRDTFKRSATNRIKGIALAGRRLAKEEVLDEAEKSDRKNTMALARHWRDHLGHIGAADYYRNEGERKGRDPKPHEKRAAAVEKKVAAKWGKSAAKDMATHNWHVVGNDGIANSNVRGPVELRKKHNIARHWKGDSEGDLYESIDEAVAINERNTESHPSLWDTHELVHSSGKVLKKGAVIKDFNGEKHKIKGFEMPHHSGSTGRVYTDQGSFFPGVVDAKIKKKKAVKEETVNEVSRSTIAKLATARYNQAQGALKQKDFGGYVKKMGKAIKASNATTPVTGWSPEEDKKNEEVSAQEKYRQIKEAKVRNALGGRLGPIQYSDKKVPNMDPDAIAARKEAAKAAKKGK